MADFLDLDKLVPGHREIKLGGKIWKISGEISVKDTLKLLDLWQKFGTSPDSPEEIKEVFQHLTIFFKEHQPDITAEKLTEMIKFSQMTQLIMFLFNSMVVADKELDAILNKEPEKKDLPGTVPAKTGQ